MQHNNVTNLEEIILRSAFIILCLFLVSMYARSRELTPLELEKVNPLQNTLTVKKYIEKRINLSKLSFSEFISYQVLKRSCDSLEQRIQHINRAPQGHPDQAKNLELEYENCSNGMVRLSRIYTKQNS